MNFETNTLEKQWNDQQQNQLVPSNATPTKAIQTLHQQEACLKVSEIKNLLIKFRTQHLLQENSPDFHHFARLLALNDQLQTPKNLCVKCWSFTNLQQTMDHAGVLKHQIMYQDKFQDIERFLQVAREYNKVKVNTDLSLMIQTPTSVPRPLEQIKKIEEKKRIEREMELGAGVIGSDIMMNNNSSFQARQNEGSDSNQMLIMGEGSAQAQLPVNMPNYDPQNSESVRQAPDLRWNGPPCPPGHPWDPFGEDREFFKERIEGAALFAPPEERNPHFWEQYGRDPKFYKEAKSLLDLGETNSNLEMIRMNKKFDIFLRRFIKVEEDIREIKNNFFRVMHCAFAKYEEGFKRKNEYLERRRVKKREEIERGVTKELEKRKIDGLVREAGKGNSSDENETRNLNPNQSHNFNLSEEDDNEFEGDMDERRFMRTMARQDDEERTRYDKQQKEEQEIKRRKSMLSKKRQTLVKQLQELDDPSIVEKLDEEQRKREEEKKMTAEEKIKRHEERQKAERKRRMKETKKAKRKEDAQRYKAFHYAKTDKKTDKKTDASSEFILESQSVDGSVKTRKTRKEQSQSQVITT